MEAIFNNSMLLTLCELISDEYCTCRNTIGMVGERVMFDLQMCLDLSFVISVKLQKTQQVARTKGLSNPHVRQSMM
jgi:hypothetical protein